MAQNSVYLRKKHEKSRRPQIDDLIAQGRGQEVVDNLTERQKRFIEEYSTNFNAKDAVLRAGYECSEANAKRMGYELLCHPGIMYALGIVREERMSKAAIDPTYVIKKVMHTLERAEREGKHSVVLKGCELLARHLGMFIERQEISGPNGDPIKYEQVREAADAFTSAISSLIERGREGPTPFEIDTGAES